MKSLAENFVHLSGMRYWMSLEESAAAPAGRLAALEEFGSNPGELGAHYHMPAACPPHAPLVVVLHGCTQPAAAYDHHAGWSRLADEAGFVVLYPEQQQANNPNLCFNWFRPGDIRRDAGEAHSIRQMIEVLIVKHDLDRDRIFITGLSAGGAMAAVMLATYPEVFASGAVIAGLAYGGANTVFEALDCMRGSRASSDADLLGLVQSASSHGGPWPSITIWQGRRPHRRTLQCRSHLRPVARHSRPRRGAGPVGNPRHPRPSELVRREGQDTCRSEYVAGHGPRRAGGG